MAAISVVAYNGIQERARDSQRQSDMASIQKALAIYHVDHDTYPQSIIPSGGGGGWEISNNLAPGRTFMQTLGNELNTEIPVDPANTDPLRYEYISLNSNFSFSNGCRINQSFYVLKVTYESANSVVPSGTPAATCDGASGWISNATVKYYGPAHAKQ